MIRIHREIGVSQIFASTKPGIANALTIKLYIKSALSQTPQQLPAAIALTMPARGASKPRTM